MNSKYIIYFTIDYALVLKKVKKYYKLLKIKVHYLHLLVELFNIIVVLALEGVEC